MWTRDSPTSDFKLFSLWWNGVFKATPPDEEIINYNKKNLANLLAFNKVGYWESNFLIVKGLDSSILHTASQK